MSRIEGMPIYQQQHIEIDASLYNLWLRSKHFISYPIRFPLEGYRDLVMILEEHEWLCADESQYDMPIIGWIEFQDKGRDALHTPVGCTRNYYHFAAKKIDDAVLKLMQQELEQRVAKLSG